MKIWRFHGLEPSNGSGSLILGSDDEELDLMRLLIALVSELASGSLFLKVGVSSFAGSMCAGPGIVTGEPVVS